MAAVASPSAVADGGASRKPLEPREVDEPAPIDLSCYSAVQLRRLQYAPHVPAGLAGDDVPDVFAGEPTTCTLAADEPHLRRAFPATFGAPILHVGVSEVATETAIDSAAHSAAFSAIGEDAPVTSTGSSASASPTSAANAAAAAATAAAASAGSSAGVATPKALAAAHLRRVGLVVERGARVGIVFCGRQSPGGHNVVWGVAAMAERAGGEAIGFVGGTQGLFAGEYVRLTPALVARYRNQGGYHLLGRTADQIRSAEQLERTLATCEALSLTGLVMVGGTHTATDAAHLAEFLRTRQTGAVRTSVVACPVSIDGDMKNQFIESTLGFDSACKTYSQLVGNTCTDANSARKYWYFIRLMGRNVSHIALEVALQTRPNVVVLGEEIARRKLGLRDVVAELADLVCARAAAGKNFGVVLVPEGLITYVPELSSLIDEMNALFAEGCDADAVAGKLTPWSRALLEYLPPLIRSQLLLEREVHGTVQLSQVSTESMLADLIGEELARRSKTGVYKGSYGSQSFFFGYQARCSLPSNFDCAYGYALGLTAAALALHGATGYSACVRGLLSDPSAWRCVGVPITAMMEVQRKPTGTKAVFPTAHVDVGGAAFRKLSEVAGRWGVEEHYHNPGAIQFDGYCADDRTLTLAAESHDYLERIAALGAMLDAVKAACRPGVSVPVLEAAMTGMASLEHMIRIIRSRDL